MLGDLQHFFLVLLTEYVTQKFIFFSFSFRVFVSIKQVFGDGDI